MDPRATPVDEQTRESRGGRHLDQSRDDVIRGAALRLLADVGYDRVTMDAVAAEAAAGKATIYRRWSNKAELIVDAITCAKPMEAVPDTGSLRGDLYAMSAWAGRADSVLDTTVMIGLVSALPHDADLRTVFVERLVRPHELTLRGLFDRARARGEVDRHAKTDLVASIMPALVFHRLLLVGEPPSEEFFRDVIDGVVMPLVSSSAVAPVTASSAPVT